MFELIYVILAFLLSVALARIIIPRIIFISLQKKLFDLPDPRKVHKKAVPRLGGVSFFPAALFSFCATFSVFLMVSGSGISYDNFLLSEMLWLICGMTLLYLTGIADDLVGVRYRQKFIIQVISACFIVLSGLWINNLYGLFGIHEVPAWIGMPLTVLVVVYITNAINLIDGIDGLASGMSSVALVFFAFLFASKGLWSYSVLAAAMFGVLVPFFYYNVFGTVETDRKVFMGDTGSLTLGYMLSFLAIKFCQVNPEMMPYTEGAFVIAFSTLIVPCFDVIRVVFVRVRNGKNPFEPDRNHIHHKMLALGLTPRQAMVSLLCMSAAFSVSNILLMPYIPNTIMLIADVAIWIGLHLYWDNILKHSGKGGMVKAD